MKKLFVDTVSMNDLTKEFFSHGIYDPMDPLVNEAEDVLFETFCDHLFEHALATHHEHDNANEITDYLFRAGFEAAHLGIDHITVVKMWDLEVIMGGSAEKLLRDFTNIAKEIK